jgi:tetratricopeptide (TPR) repeat protein
VASLLLVFWVASMVNGYLTVIAARQKDHFLINDMFTQISEDELLNQPGMQGLRQKLLGKALQHYQELLKESGGSQSLQDEVAAAHYRVGMIRQEIGQYEEAEAEFITAINEQRHLLEAQPNDPKRLEALSDTLNAQGKLLTLTDRLADAAESYAQANDLRTELAHQAPENKEWQRKLASVQGNLGMVQLNRGQEENGRQHIRDAQERRLAILNVDPQFATARRDLAMGYFILAKFESLAYFKLNKRTAEEAGPAIENLRKAIQQFDLLDAKEGESLTNRYYMAAANRLLGDVLAESGDLENSILAYEAAKEPMTSLALGNPKVELYKAELALLEINQGHLYRDKSDFSSAIRAYSQAQGLLQKLLARDSQNLNYRMDMGGTLAALGHVQLLSGAALEAKPTLEAAMLHLEALMADSSGDAILNVWLEDARKDLESIRASEQDTDESTQ